MKKIQLNPLALDKETIAKLDEKQLLEITGGVSSELEANSTSCGSGYSTCEGGGSNECSSGSSQCLVDEA